jgi:predicted PurR-regulated permease PerM
MVLVPAVSSLERLRLRRGIGIFIVMAVLVGVAGLIGWTVLPQFVDLMAQMPQYQQEIQHKIDQLKKSAGGKLSTATESVKSLENQLASKGGSAGSNTSGGQGSRAPAPGTSPSRPLSVQMVNQSNPLEAAKGLADPIGTAIAVLVFAIFILAGREDLRNRLIKLTSGGRLTVMTQAMTEAWSRIIRYLFMQMLVNSCYGVVVAVALHLLGLPNAALWGLFAGLLRYLPYVGWMIAAAMPTGLALAVFPGWEHAIVTVCIFIGLEIIVANAIEPVLYGANVGLAPLAILVSAVFWTLIWGFPGLLLATPMTVCLVVIGRYVPSLGFLSILLGNEPVMPPAAQFYQRLLAGDENEARQILENYVKQGTLEDLYESVMLPALARSEQDGYRNELDEDTRSFIDSTSRELAEEIAASAEDRRESGETVLEFERAAREATGQPKVLCIPARDEADDVFAMILRQLLERRGAKAENLPIAPSAEILAQVSELHPQFVCILALPPLVMNHVRLLYAKLRSQAPALPIVVCLWHFEGDPQKAGNLLRLSPRDKFFTTLPDVLHYFSGQESPVAPDISREPHPV